MPRRITIGAQSYYATPRGLTLVQSTSRPASAAVTTAPATAAATAAAEKREVKEQDTILSELAKISLRLQGSSHSLTH